MGEMIERLARMEKMLNLALSGATNGDQHGDVSGVNTR